MSRDLRKPQYIDFRSPLFVGLFGKMTLNLKRYAVLLEERYPAAAQLPRYEDRAYATELILQLNFPDPHGTPLIHTQLEEHADVVR